MHDLIDRDGRTVDVFGRRQPGQFNALSLERAAPGLLSHFDTWVPNEWWDADGDAVVIRCGCDHVVVVDRPGAVRCCDGCDRAFLWTGRAVRRAIAPHVEDDDE